MSQTLEILGVYKDVQFNSKGVSQKLNEFIYVEGRRGQPKEIRVININCQFKNCDFVAPNEESYFIHIQTIHNGGNPFIYDLWAASGLENMFFQITNKTEENPK